MPSEKDHAALARELQDMLDKSCPGMAVTVAHSPRWQRMCLTFHWDGFRGMLPEERFRLVAKRVPPAYFETHCRGAVWVELAGDESIEDYLALPRSEDIDARLNDVWADLAALNFFAALEDELVRVPAQQCPDDFTFSKRVLSARKATREQTRDAMLAFMRHEAYTDWEVLAKIRPIAERSGKKRR